MPAWLVGIFQLVPLFAAVIMIGGLALQIAYPRRISWIDHFPVEEEKTVEQRARENGGA